MRYDEIAKWASRAGAWIENYHEGLCARPVREPYEEGAIERALPERAPAAPEPMEAIFADFERLIPSGLLHWQHPRFFGYFPATAAPASMIADQLTAGLAVNAMLWETSPSVTELEQVMIRWLGAALGLGDGARGVIHDTATTGTICAILTMRERALGWHSNEEGLSAHGTLRVYASAENHSSIEKGVVIAGIGRKNLVRVPTRGADRGLDPDALDAAIRADRARGLIPAGVVLVVGGTSAGAIDPVRACLQVARDHDLYVHLDAAWAGSAMICPEFRPLWEGAQRADSIVVNPHKWLGAQLDCAVQFLADPGPQARTLGLRPTYLEAEEGEDRPNFNEWSLALGRRARALKLWFVLRAYGTDQLAEMIRSHVRWTHEVRDRFAADPNFEIVTGSPLALFTFRCAARGADPSERTRALLAAMRADGRVYLTGTEIDDRFVIRVTAGSWACGRADVHAIYEVARELAGAP